MAEKWIDSHDPSYADGTQVVFAITKRDNESLLGAIGLTLNSAKGEAEVGYWVGVPFWNKGIATEATEAVIDYGFSQLGLSRIRAWHLSRNPASGRVMQKAGMRKDERSRKTVEKDGQEEELSSYCLTRSDWVSR